MSPFAEIEIVAAMIFSIPFFCLAEFKRESEPLVSQPIPVWCFRKLKHKWKRKKLDTFSQRDGGFLV